MRPSDAIWLHRSGSTLAQVKACCLTAPSHYLNQCNDLASVKSSGIHLRAVSWEIPHPPFTKISLKITYLKLNWNLPGVNELISLSCICSAVRLSVGPSEVYCIFDYKLDQWPHIDGLVLPKKLSRFIKHLSNGLYIFSIQFQNCEIYHQTFGPGYRKYPTCPMFSWTLGLVQDCSISSVLAMEILQSCTKSLIQDSNP